MHLGFHWLQGVTERNYRLLIALLLARRVYEFYLKIILSFSVPYTLSTKTTPLIQKDETKPVWVCGSEASGPMVLPPTLLGYWSPWRTRKVLSSAVVEVLIWFFPLQPPGVLRMSGIASPHSNQPRRAQVPLPFLQDCLLSSWAGAMDQHLGLLCPCETPTGIRRRGSRTQSSESVQRFFT